MVHKAINLTKRYNGILVFDFTLEEYFIIINYQIHKNSNFLSGKF